MQNNIKKILITILLLCTTVYIGCSLFSYKSFHNNSINYPEFEKMVEQKKVSEVIIGDYRLSIKTTDGLPNKTTDNGLSPTFRESMLKNNVEVKKSKLISFTNILGSVLWYIVGTFISVYVIFFIFNLLSSSSSGLGKYGKLNEIGKRANKKNNKYSFDDVAGIDEVKESLQEIVDYIKNPEKVKNIGIRPPKGIILEGLPGTGKTLLAKAVAGEANVPFYYASGSDFVQMFVGVGALRVRELFKKAKENSPCVLFIDEIDAVAKKRGGFNNNDEREQTVNALLTEMDGFADANGIIVLAATNRIDTLDPALLRPGRFDRKITVGLPDKKGREKILNIHARNKAIDESVDLSKIAQKTVGFSGAELENLLNESGWDALKHKQQVIKQENIVRAIDKIIVGDSKKNSDVKEKDLKRVAYHEVGHALITRFIAKRTIERITVIPAGSALGFVMPTQTDVVLQGKDYLLNDICIKLGGRAAEIVAFGEDTISTGASKDLEQATSIASNMIYKFGMGDIGLVSFNDEMLQSAGDKIKYCAFVEINTMLKKQLNRAVKFLTENKNLLELVTKTILEKESLDGDEFEMLVKDYLNKLEEIGN